MNELETIDAAELHSLARSARPILVDFVADWCAPCKKLDPVLTGLAAEFDGDLRIVRVDATDDDATASSYGVDGFPGLVMINNGQIVGRLFGLRSRDDLREHLKLLVEVRHGSPLPETKRVAVADNATTAQDRATEVARVLVFPEEPVGVLRFTPGARGIPATGTVRVPAGTHVGLNVRSDTKGIDLSFLTALPSDGLDHLAVIGPVTDEELAPIAHLTGLRVLQLAGELVTGSGFTAFGPRHRLRKLMLNCPALNDDGMRTFPALPELTSLDMYNSEGLGDAGIAPLRALPLTSLDLCAHGATDEGVAGLLRELVDLTGLTVCVPDVTDESMRALGGLRRLGSLTLETPRITGRTVESLTALPDLRSLALYGIPLGDDVIDHLAEVRTLRRLRLEDDGPIGEETYRRLTEALPECEINGTWLAPEAIAHRFGGE
ncbi:thioredoxin domain-containing protein [Amycolatopsis pigmentata]|uniref:Thioredoxin domain-containing protein n=1 Tax=Amycolatopsis pigmentata TaxID=450801 RepID=A0ABW5G5M1_9PSEU